MRHLCFLAALSCLAVTDKGADQWTVARSAHFEVYSQTSDATAAKALHWFEQLRTFFQQSGLGGGASKEGARRRLRVIGFESQKEYDAYRLRRLADASYITGESGDYILMTTLQPREFGVAAHEYAHYILHTDGMQLPAFLNEGLAEFFSTIRVSGDGYEVGGDLPERLQTLRRRKWLSLEELIQVKATSMPDAREDAEIFYAESWALADMLLTSPEYAAGFRALVQAFDSNRGSGGDTARAFEEAYGETLDQVRRSLDKWLKQRRLKRVVAGGQVDLFPTNVQELSAHEAELLLARISVVSGHLEQARLRYERLLREEPDNASFLAELGSLALREGRREEALKQWRAAMEHGSTDAEICYRYALLAEDSGANAEGVKTALERAVALKPDFDDARYKLALMEEQAGDDRLAVEQLREMRTPGEARRYGYWMAMASALTDLDEREEAKAAAQRAVQAAQNETDRMRAREMLYMASTDLTVQFERDEEGHSRMTTTRVQHGTSNWNPFIEPSDRMQRASGKLDEVLCTAGKLSGFLVSTANGELRVDVPDPMHVLVRNGPSEMFCGAVEARPVEADFAVVVTAGKTRNVLRGMTFR